MENNSNYSFSSYPDSHDSSPRSREIDSENPSSWDELPPNYKVKFMCSYGGKIHPRPHDNQLAYVGGDTKILAVDRSIRFSDFVSKLSSLCQSHVCFKYQLPGEDLDALISVTNDEDLEHMMLEYDRLYRASAKPARLRLFLFQLNPNPAPSPAPAAAFGTSDTKSERQWFVDALNSVQIQTQETSSPPAAAAASGNPDFLFGFDKGIPPDPPTKPHDPAPAPATVQDAFPKDTYVGSDDRFVVGDPVVSPAEIQELQRLQIASHEQAIFQKKSEENNPRAYPAGDYYPQIFPETLPPTPQSVPVTVPAGSYWQERNVTSGGYAMAGATGTDQQVYIIPTPGGYQAATIRPVTSQVGQAYYGMPRMGQMVYRELPVYNAGPSHGAATVQHHSKVVGAGAYSEGVGTVRSSGVGVATVVEAGYPQQFSYDGSSRQQGQVYYTAAGGPYQAVTAAADGRQGVGGGGVVTQEGKVVAKAATQAPTV